MSIAVFTALSLIYVFFASVIFNEYKKMKLRKAEAQDKAQKIISDAELVAQNKERELLLSAKEEILKNKSELDNEIKERRAEVQQLSNKVLQKEEILIKKTDAVEKKSEALNVKIKVLETKISEADELKHEQIKMLEKISGLSRDEAKKEITASVVEEAKRDAVSLIKDIERKAKDEAEKRARNVISLAIQRCAADHVAETTVSVVSLPNDEMKGRIIGREGRNIRTLETLTGVDVIIDDTPEAVVLSGFDPIRREVARMALEKLITDGRIHPSRIEEMVSRSKKELDEIIKQEGEQAAFETGVHGLHSELIKLIGKLRYRTSYGQNVLKHSIEVAHIAGIMAAEIGADVALAKRAGLLHDVGKGISHDVEGSHVTIGVDVIKKYGENADVIHAVMAHHGDVEPTTVVAVLVQAADAISAARPGARRENISTYIKRLEKLEEIASSFSGVERSFAIQAGREVRIIVDSDSVSDENTILLASEVAKRIENEMEYPGQIKVNVVRELRAIEYAK